MADTAVPDVPDVPPGAEPAASSRAGHDGPAAAGTALIPPA
ncbi:hypothetical protein [Dactylosporangium roseum]|nr:hypothetical protein [Dactylosporangium roseum]